MTDVLWVLAYPSINGSDDWEYGGVFSTLEKARAACQTRDDEIWKEHLNEVLPRETVDAEYIEWPIRGVCKIDGVYYSIDRSQRWNEDFEDWETND